MNDHIVYNLQKGDALAAEIEPTTPERRSWICVYPYKTVRFGQVDPPAKWCYRVRCFEVDKRLLAERNNDLDGDEEFIITREDIRLTTIDELEECLLRWIHGEIDLIDPYRCDYPC